MRNDNTNGKGGVYPSGRTCVSSGRYFDADSRANDMPAQFRYIHLGLDTHIHGLLMYVDHPA